MGLIDEILETLEKTNFTYKGVRVNIFGLPKFKNRTYGNMRSTLSYMNKKGLIENGDKGWHLTPAGKNYMKKKEDSFTQFENQFSKDAPKNLIVMFDIPETKKAHREWFRWHLKKFNYKMIQRSVWVGPSPLPKEFLKYATSIGLKDCLKTFKLARSYK